MKINIICIGNVKEQFYRDAIKEYEKRMSKFDSLSIIELKEEKLRDTSSAEEERVIKAETEKIIQTLDKSKGSYNILLDISGKNVTSEELSSIIYDLRNNNTASYREINFIIGGSLGVDDELRKKVNFRLSFSKMTFPHQLMRVILMEQIYRAYKIMNDEDYHK